MEKYTILLLIYFISLLFAISHWLLANYHKRGKFKNCKLYYSDIIIFIMSFIPFINTCLVVCYLLLYDTFNPLFSKDE